MQQLLIELWQTWKFTVVLVTHDVSEAVTTAQRVVMLDKGQVKLDLEVSAAYPRSTTQANIATLERQILAAIMQPDRPIETKARQAI